MHAHLMHDVKKESSKRKEKEKILIYSLNVQSLRAKKAELEYHLSQICPHIVLLQETWLDASTEDFCIEGYVIISRRDRHSDANRGGIITLCRQGFNHLVFIKNSKNEERSWHFLNLDPEVILLGN